MVVQSTRWGVLFNSLSLHRVLFKSPLRHDCAAFHSAQILAMRNCGVPRVVGFHGIAFGRYFGGVSLLGPI